MRGLQNLKIISSNLLHKKLTLTSSPTFMMSELDYCYRCDIYFSRKSSLNRHIQNFHNENNDENHIKSCYLNDKLKCFKCSKHFSRSDNLKRHLEKCIVNDIPNLNKEIENDLVEKTRKYKLLIKKGEEILNVLKHRDDILEAALDSEDKKALECYKNSITIDNNNILLRSWQNDLMKHLHNPDDRQVIWVNGSIGNEGKSFFQRYILSLYGSRKVINLDLVKNSSDIFHILSKQDLSCREIFLFNVPRNLSSSDIPYDVLEGIKDGQIICQKYNSRLLKIKTPNIVMVFSNDFPINDVLSLDRWKMLRIINNELVTLNGWKFKSKVSSEEYRKTMTSQERKYRIFKNPLYL